MPTAQQLVSQGFGGYTGWGDVEAAANFKATGGKGKETGGAGATTAGAPTGATPDYGAIIKQQQEASRAAVQPAVEALQTSIPTTQAKFGALQEQTRGEIEPLKSRYQDLISKITGKGLRGEEAQTRVTAGEIGKRGIPLTSTIAGQEIQRAVQPIRETTQGLIKETGLAQETDIRALQNQLQNLGLGETEAVNAINQAIAQTQAGAGQGAIQSALSMFGMQQAGQQGGAQLALQQLQLGQQQKQADIANRLAQQQFEQVSLPTTEAQLANIRSQIAERGRDGGDDSFSDMLKTILGGGGGTPLPQVPNYFTPIG